MKLLDISEQFLSMLNEKAAYVLFRCDTRVSNNQRSYLVYCIVSARFYVRGGPSDSLRACFNCVIINSRVYRYFRLVMWEDSTSSCFITGR